MGTGVGRGVSRALLAVLGDHLSLAGGEIWVSASLYAVLGADIESRDLAVLFGVLGADHLPLADVEIWVRAALYAVFGY